MIPPARHFDVICFDCDSTLSCIEGIDELARRAGVEADVAPLTEAAMTGELSLDAVYARRLDMVRPDRAAITWLGQRYIEETVSGANEAVAALTEAGKEVHIVSGGLRQAIAPLAETLGIPLSRVHAVDVFFDDDGSYRDFDRAAPLARPDGKAVICRALAGQDRGLALVGDGASDLEARAANAFIIGFGGVARRELLVTEADVFVEGPELTAVLGPLQSL